MIFWEKGYGPMIGKYDAVHGDKPFMYGVASVMEYIAYNANGGYWTRV